MENPEALGFHQETRKNQHNKWKRWKIQQKSQDWFHIKLYIIFWNQNFTLFFCIGARNIKQLNNIHIVVQKHYF